MSTAVLHTGTACYRGRVFLLPNFLTNMAMTIDSTEMSHLDSASILDLFTVNADFSFAGIKSWQGLQDLCKH